jgi:hypothetical protein
MTEILKALESIEFFYRSQPRKIKMSTTFFEKLKESVPEVNGQTRFETIYGVPFEIDDTVNGYEIEYERR